MRFVVSAEHGGNRVPDAYRGLFAGSDGVLESHRGYDPGSLGVATRLSARLSAPLVACLTTRLLIEPNRSVGHSQLFSEFTRSLPEVARRALIEEIYHPHRASVERAIAAAIVGGHHVVHVGVHSFTDVLDGVTRAVDVGVLFDPARTPEGRIAAAWLDAILRARPDLHCAPNEPYLGTDDGLTTALRGRFPPEAYTGFEVEVRQGLIAVAEAQRAMGEMLAATLDAATCAC